MEDTQLPLYRQLYRRFVSRYFFLRLCKQFALSSYFRARNAVARLQARLAPPPKEISEEARQLARLTDIVQSAIAELARKHQQHNARLDELVAAASRRHELLATTSQRLESIEAALNRQSIEAARKPRRAAQKHDAINIVFFVQSAAIWPSWQSFWQACSEDPRFNTTVVLTPFRYPDRELPSLDEARRLLIEQNIGFMPADNFSLEDADIDVAVIQLPYTDSLPAHLQLNRLADAGIKTIYIPYGLEVGGGGLNLRYQFDLPLHRTAWRIFARSEQHKKLYARHCSAGSAHVVVTGHPRFDIAATNAWAPPLTGVRDAIAGRKVVLWNAHFSVQKTAAWSTFDLLGHDIQREFRQRTDLFLIFRPHPLLFQTLRKSGFWNDADETSLRQEFMSRENWHLDESSHYTSAFELSDTLITDIGSFVLEYLATGRPLLLLKNPDGFGLSDDGEIERAVYSATSAKEITSFLDMITRGEDPEQAKRQRALPELLFGLDGHAGERIRDHVHDALKRRDNVAPRSLEMLHPAGTQLPRPVYPSSIINERQTALRQLLADLPRAGASLVIGGNDPKLVEILADRTTSTHVIDPDPNHIAFIANSSQTWTNAGEVRATVDSLTERSTVGVYDLIVCMDVLSMCPSTTEMLNQVERLGAMLRRSGLLIVGDLQATGSGAISIPVHEVSTLCQNRSHYRAMFERRGYTIIASHTCSEAENESVERTYHAMRAS